MGKEFQFQLNSTGVLPLSLNGEDRHPLGFRIYPRAEFNIEGFYVRGGVEVGASYFDGTPLGISYFDTDPAFYYLANLGYTNGDFNFRFGRHRYEQTDIENLITNNAYQASATFANLTVPLGWVGTELRYDREREGETLRRVATELAYMRGDDGTHLGLLQGMLTFTLDPENLQHLFSLAANGTVRGDAGPDSGLFEGTGTSFGFGLAAQYQFDWFSVSLAYLHSGGSFENESETSFEEQRDAFTLLTAFTPGDWLVQGSYTFLSQIHQENLIAGPPVYGTNEHHLEAQVGYQPVGGLLISAGYRAAFPQEFPANHFLFLGIQTSFSGIFNLQPGEGESVLTWE